MVRLSGGELHRAMLARALLRQPDFLVLDEPMSGVDVAGQVKLYQLIENIRDSYNCGVLLISHDLHVVMAATDRVVCLNHHICCTGKPASVVGEPEFRALFGTQVADQLALYHHHHDHGHGTDGAVVALSDLNEGASSNRDDTDDYLGEKRTDDCRFYASRTSGRFRGCRDSRPFGMLCNLAWHDLFWRRSCTFSLVGRRFSFIPGLATRFGHWFSMSSNGWRFFVA